MTESGFADRLARLLPKPRRRPFRLIQVEAALACNLRCVMCPWSGMRPHDGLMRWETFTSISPSFPLARGMDLTGGGEPLLHPRLTEMARIALGSGCEVGFSTNGMGLTREVAQEVVQAGQQWIAFSVDGATAPTYERIRTGASFERVIGHIAGLADAKRAAASALPRMMLVFVMMRDNYAELPELIDLAARLGVTQVIAKNLDVILKDGDDGRRLFEHGGEPAPADLPAIISEAQRRATLHQVGLRLYAAQPQELAICEHDPLASLFVNWEGFVAPCITLAYAEERVFRGERVRTPTLRFGNVRDSSLTAIWQSPDYRAFRRPFEQRVQTSRLAAVDLILDGSTTEPAPPPAGCATCYYLYGV